MSDLRAIPTRVKQSESRLRKKPLGGLATDAPTSLGELIWPHQMT
jgi:hypothetical protein